jgi:hypothetical protein
MTIYRYKSRGVEASEIQTNAVISVAGTGPAVLVDIFSALPLSPTDKQDVDDSMNALNYAFEKQDPTFTLNQEAAESIGDGAMASWKEPAWFIDPAAGNDLNSGTVIGSPLQTYAELVKRWGTISPVLFQDTTVTFLSDQPGLTDPVAVSATCVEGGVLSIVGQLVAQGGGAGNFSAVTVENRAGDVRWTVTDGAKPANFWTAFVGMLVHDTTTNSWFWVDADLGASTARVSAPMASATGGNAQPALQAVAAADGYQVFAPTKVNLVENNSQAASGSTCVVQHLWCTSQAFGVLLAPSFLNFVECRVDGFLSGGDSAPTFSNCFLGGGIETSGFIFGGIVNTELSTLSSTVLDGDVLVNAANVQLSDSVTIGAARFQNDVEVPNLVTAQTNASNTTVSNNAPYGIAALWGSAGLHVHVHGDLGYTGTAVGSLFMTGTLTLDGAATASSYNLGTGIWTPAIVLSPTNLDTAVGAGGFGGVAYGNFGSKIRQLN